MILKLFHATKNDFDQFDDAFTGSVPGNHGNSNLGFWFATTSDWIEAFGNKILEAEVDLGISYHMSVKELFLKSSQYQSWDLEDSFKERELWLKERQKLLDEGFSSVAIVEENNKIAMYVVLSSEKILSFKVLSDLNRQMNF